MSTLKASNIQPQSDSDPLIVSTNSTERLRIDTTGKFGIGTSTPGSALEIKNFVSSTTTQGITGTVANAGILLDVDFQSPVATRYSSGLFWRDSALNTLPVAGIWVGDENSNGSSLHLGTSQTYANGINKIGLSVRNGFVGVGITGPEVPLHANTTLDEVVRLNSSGNPYISLYKNGSRVAYFWAASTGLSITQESALPIIFQTNATEKMRLTSGGNLGIGTTNPSVALDVVGTIKTDTALTIGGSTLSAPSGSAPMYAARAWVVMSGNGTSNPTILNDGNIASVSRVSTGLYRVTFTQAMPNANYSVVISGDNLTNGQGGVYLKQGTKTTTQFDFNHAQLGSFTLADIATGYHCNIVVYC